jgi:predicted secreted protein
MPWVLGLALYFIIWWTFLFAVLPFGVHSQHEMNDIVPGSDPGAPARPRLLLKVLATTIVAGVVWAIVDYFYLIYFIPSIAEKN